METIEMRLQRYLAGLYAANHDPLFGEIVVFNMHRSLGDHWVYTYELETPSIFLSEN